MDSGTTGFQSFAVLPYKTSNYAEIGGPYAGVRSGETNLNITPATGGPNESASSPPGVDLDSLLPALATRIGADHDLSRPVRHSVHRGHQARRRRVWVG